MATVYLKTGETVQVSLDNLEDYLYENHERIETRKKELRRPTADKTTSVSSK